MRKLSTAIIMFFTLCLSAKGKKTASADSLNQLLSGLKKKSADSVRLKILTRLGSYYLYKPGELKSDLDVLRNEVISECNIHSKNHLTLKFPGVNDIRVDDAGKINPAVIASLKSWLDGELKIVERDDRGAWQARTVPY